MRVSVQSNPSGGKFNGPYIFSIKSGQLPLGLALSKNGLVHGIVDRRAKLGLSKVEICVREVTSRSGSPACGTLDFIISSSSQSHPSSSPSPTASSAAVDCLSGIKCSIGDTGPGGGTVFYDAGSKQSWGQYLEVAPANWSGGPDPISVWCSDEGSLIGPVPPTQNGIGDGLSNTNIMLSLCSSGAANTAHAYQGGGKSDWFLPSRDELEQLCLYANGQTIISAPNGCGFGKLKSGFSSGYYWSSSASGGDAAWNLYFDTGSWVNWWRNSIKSQSGSNLGNDVSVRPIREF